MKCIIVDDEPLARQGIELNAEDIDFLDIVAQFSNPVKANSWLKNNHADLMFLDIQMPALNGLDFLRGLENPPMTILTTAHSEYALSGFELDVLDYLVKPISMSRFMKAVNKALELHQLRKESNGGKSMPVEKEPKTRENKTIYIKSDRRMIRMKLDDIVMIEGMKDYVMVYTSEERFSVAMNLKTFHGRLPGDGFVRISKSNIINPTHIQEISNNHVHLPGHKVSIGRTFKDDFMDRFVRKKLIERN
ncbi:MAG: DNA-binding response regulator [Saprospirales bacterium]|nr:MAG: DNA-binding response regulator [Saprospirales bacterium]